ncbi:MAG: hypothetical protein AB7E47_05895 [Desulfovibrionaceae bacterium]
MTRSGLVRDTVRLLDKGYRLYVGPVEAHVYEDKPCPRSARPTWFVRDATYLCMGCAKACALKNPAGFQTALPMHAARLRPYAVALAELPTVTVDQLLAIGRPLRVDEAAWALAVSPRQIYYLVETGVLDVAAGGTPPVRVTAESVRRHLDSLPA